METISSTTNISSRSKKLPPPPLCLPATKDEEKFSHSISQRERKKSSNNCCLSSSDDCPHQSISYTLPTSQRSKILETLIASSSVLLAQPISETKHRRSSNLPSVNHLNLLKQRRPSSKVTIADAEWIDFMRSILRKPLEHELKLLLDKYKMTYFDRINAPNTTDDTVRSSLCTMVTEALMTYSTHSVSPPTTDETAINAPSPISSNTNANNGSSKRKRKSNSLSLLISTPGTINNQTKFVISYIVPGVHDTTNNTNRTVNQQQQKQFQKKYSHLFWYIPEKDLYGYLVREDRIKTISTSPRSPNNNNNNDNNICLMLYDEVALHMDDYDLELSGISLDHSFTLPEPSLTQIHSSIQQTDT